MELEIETYGTLPCRPIKFTVNDKKASTGDFGYSETYGDVDEYECSNVFVPYEIVSSNILEKYEISKGEYHQICEKLKEKLRVTNCGWCS